ncbi:MAG TPA: chromate resistance protein [Cellvibrionaceae bacterium]|nr:chromate resistance protein [Cellvibrionaceae bacterium]
MNEWIALVLSLPTQNATVRMRAWRSLKASGVAVLRDGVYLLPNRASGRQLFASIQDDVQASGGTAFILQVADDTEANFPALFDRQEEYALLLEELSKLQATFSADSLASAIKQLRKLRKALAGIVAIDYFPTAALTQTEAALVAAEVQLNRLVSPDEPHPMAGAIELLDPSNYAERYWATRRRPWVDRLASAWLIRRYIDATARFIWLESPEDCPPHALGFDFDGATFSHVGAMVTFEVLLASFDLQQPALQRLGAVVHYLDTGGVQPPEASGLEQILWGLRNTLEDDDQLLSAACGVFDALLSAFIEKV